MQLIKEMIKMLGASRIERYASDIRSSCVANFRRDNSNAVRAECLSALERLLELRLLDADASRARETFELLMREFSSGKGSQTVKAACLRVSGLLSELFPDQLHDRNPQAISACLDALAKQFHAAKPDMQLIAGAIDALRSLLVYGASDFAASATAKGVQGLYKYVCLALEPPERLSRYDIPKAGLRFVSSHSQLLREYLAEDAELMYGRLSALCTHQNSKLRHLALGSLDAFLATVGRELISGARAPERDKQTFKFFVASLFGLLEAPGSSTHHVAMAIRGLGKLAVPMRTFLGEEELKRMLDTLYRFAERLLPGGSSAGEDALQHAARFVGSYASIAAQLADIDEARIGQLERLVAALFHSYPDLHSSQRPAHHLSLAQVICAVHGKGSALQNLLSRFVVQGLLTACSQPQQVIGYMRLEGVVERVDAVPLYVEYLPLWEHLLQPELELAAKDTLPGLTAEQAQSLRTTVYDVFVQGVVQLIQRLDLSYTVRKADGADAKASQSQMSELSSSSAAPEASGAPLSALQPRVPKDMEIFLSLVELVKRLLSTTCTASFMRWPYLFGREVAAMSARLPLISGFYKLATLSLRLCEKHKYFKRLPAAESAMTDDGGGGGEQAHLCLSLYSKFVREVSVRLQQYQDELLCACLELVLSAPHQLIEPRELVAPVRQALLLGVSHAPIAAVAIDSLQRWFRKAPGALDPFLADILPCFDGYLLVPVEDPAAADLVVPTASAPAAPASSPAGPVAKRAAQRPMEARRTRLLMQQTGTDITAAELQRRVVRLLGTLGGLNGGLLGGVGGVDLSDESRLREPAIRWEKDNRIQLKLPLADTRPVMHLDALLPRLLVLAESSSDRQTKVLACELLHSVVLLMIGHAAHSADAKAAAQVMGGYNARVFPCLLRLATDAEVVTRQLFEPLLFQIIHWVTALPGADEATAKSTDAKALLGALTDGVCSRGQSSLRELSARCIGEFVSWAIKHTPSIAKDPASVAGRNVGALLRQVFGLARHPDPYRRLGAAAALQSIMRPLREEPGLVSLFVLEIAHNALFSLRLAHDDEESFAAGTQMVAAFRGVVKVVVHFATELNARQDGRACHADLQDFLRWAHRSVSRRETLCRKQCMAALTRLAPLVPASGGSLEGWFKSNPPAEVFEDRGTLLLQSDPTAGPRLPSPESPYATLSAWYENVAASLECYTWAANYGVKPQAVGGCLFRALLHFVRELGTASPSRSLSAAEADSLSARRSRAARAMFDYGSAFLERGIPAEAFLPMCQRLYDVLIWSILAPSVAFLAPPASSGGAGGAARTELGASAVIFSRHLLHALRGKDSEVQAFQECARRALARDEVCLAKLDFSLSGPSFRSDLVQEVAAGYSDLHDVSVLAWCLDKSLPPAQLARHLLASVFSNAASYDVPLKIAVASDLLRLALRIGVDPTILMQFLLDDTTAAEGRASSQADGQSRGRVFYSRFQSVVDEHVYQGFAAFGPLIMARVGSGLAWQLLLNAVRRRSPSRRLPGAAAGANIAAVMRSLGPIASWVAEGAALEQKERVLELLRLALQADKAATVAGAGGQFVADAMRSFLARGVPLSFKGRALSLLPMLGADAVSRVRDRVHDMITFEFPVSSADLQPGSSAFNEYLAVLDELLSALEATGSTEMLEELYPVIRERAHVHAPAINAALRRMSDTLPGASLRQVAECCLRACFDRTNPDDLKTALLTRVLAIVLERMPQEHFLPLVCDRIKQLVEEVGKPVDHGLPTPQEKRHVLFERSVNFALIRAVYDRLSPDTIRTTVNAAFAGDGAKGNELTQAVMRHAHSAKSEHVFVDGEHVTNWGLLRYHGAAYSALAAAVMRTQSKEQFFVTLFFKESADRGELVWDNIVDLEAQWKFDVETLFPVATRAFRMLQEGPDASSARRGTKGGMKYISMKYLQDSSLSQDLSYMGHFFGADPATTDTALPQQQQPADQSAGQPAARPAPQAAGDGRIEKLELELDDINKNPCMQTLVRLLEHVAAKFPGEGQDALPRWEQEMLSKLSSRESHVNVRLFLVKCIVNRPQLFSAHAARWVRPLLDAALLSATSPGIHYFLRDVCIVVLKWLKEADEAGRPIEFTTREDSDVASRFINHLMQNAVFPKRDILRSNVEIIKMFVERFKSLYVPNKRIILDMLAASSSPSSSSGKGEKQTKAMRLTGLQLLGAIIANGLPTYDVAADSSVASGFRFMTALAENLLYPKKDVSDAAAEVCGLAFAHHPEGDRSEDDAHLESLVRERAAGMFARDTGLALSCLFKIGQHHPPFLRPFFGKILDIIPTVVGELRVMALDMVRSCATDIPELYKKLRSSGIDGILKYRDDEAQHIVLETFLAILPQLSEEEISHVVAAVTAVFPQHPSPRCRNSYYGILMWVYDNCSAAPFAQDGSLRAALLRALADKSDTVRDRAVAFWDEERHVPATTSGRLFGLLREAFSPEIESAWLGTAGALLLRLSRRIPAELDEPISDRPLAKCDFSDMPIDSTMLLRRATPISTPLFASVSATQFSSPSQADAAAGNLVRATQAPPLFTPTFDPSEVMDVTDIDPSSQAQGRYKTTLLFNFEPFKAPLPPSQQRSASQRPAEPSSQVDRVKRRFTPLPATQGIIAKQLHKKRAREALLSRQASARAAAVIVLRSYRVGDLPDVQIKRRDILEPLAALAQRDQQMARLAFVEVFRAIVAPAVAGNDEDARRRLEAEKEHLREEAARAIESILAAARSCGTAFVGALHDALRAVVASSPHAPPRASPAVIGASAMRSGAIHTGVLLIEEMLSASAASAAGEAEAREEGWRDGCWAQLAQLYRAIGESDAVLGIYEQRFSRQPQTKRALECELRGDWAGARDEYEEAARLMDGDGPWEAGVRPSAQELDFWENGRLECMSKLLNWGALADNVLCEVAGTDPGTAAPPPLERLDGLFSERYRDVYLDHFVRSHVRLRERWPFLWDFVSRAATMPAAGELLEGRFSPQIAFLCAGRDDLDRARHYVLRSYRAFVQRWSRLHPLAFEARRASLQSLQVASEEEEFVEFCAFERNVRDTKSLERLLRAWRGRTPSSRDTSVWDDVISNRAFFLEKVHERFAARHAEGADRDADAAASVSRLKSRLVSERADLYHTMADAARKLRNLPVSENYMKLALKSNPQKGDFEFPFFCSLVKLYLATAAVEAGVAGRAEKFSKGAQVCAVEAGTAGGAGGCREQKALPRDRRRPVQAAGHARRRQPGPDFPCRPRSRDPGARRSPAETSFRVSLHARQQELRGVDCNRQGSEIRGGVLKTLFDRSSFFFVQDILAGHDSPASLAKSFYRFGEFCDDVLKLQQGGGAGGSETPLALQKASLAEKAATSFLEAMRSGHGPALERVPRILSLLAAYPAAQAAFKTYAATVPVWVFVPWISQLMSSLDLPEGPAVAGLLAELARAYPQAVFYPLKISRDMMGPQAKRLTDDIAGSPAMRMPRLEAFVEACELLQHPEHRLKEWLAQFKNISGQPSPANKEEMRRIVKTMVADCLEPGRPNLGDYNAEKAAAWRKALMEEAGEAAFKALVNNYELDPKLLAKLESFCPAKAAMSRPSKLRAYSTWMSSYHASEYASEADGTAAAADAGIEVPGQYGGLGKEPRPELHARITSFEEDVQVMSSMRIPKRISMLSSDQRVRRFLVKGGEDLRLDERIQQAFGLVNGFLARDAACSERRLRVHTYGVVPMTYRAGIIEWVDGTRPFKELLEEEWAARRNRVVQSLSKEATSVIRQRWIEEMAARAGEKVPQNDSLRFLLLYEHVPRDEAAREMEREHSMVPEDLMRAAVLSMSASPEAFLCLRDEFARSLSAFNAASYVLGIGDRHLDNFLLSNRHGGVVGIDFGHAFGSATQILPIPELVPFRLTRQLVGTLRPHTADGGVIKHNMAHVLRALHENRELLVDALDVFVKEPIMNWDMNITKLTHGKLHVGLPSDKRSRRWYPEKKLAVVRKKLDLVNPAHVLVEELEGSIHNKKDKDQQPTQTFRRMLEVARGDPTHNVRALVGERCSTVLQQVECLVDLATDPNILAKTYSGWLPWA